MISAVAGIADQSPLMAARKEHLLQLVVDGMVPPHGAMR
jgi:hypothetical protein